MGKNENGPGESRESCKESAAGSREQYGHDAERQKSDGHEAQRPAALAVHQEGGKRKAEIEKTGHFVGILAVGGKANLAGGNGLRGVEGGQREQGEHPGPGNGGAQQSAQIGGSVGKLPHQPDDHHLLKVAADLFQSRDGIDGPEIGTAEPEIQGEREPPERPWGAHAACLQDRRNGRDKHQQAGDAGCITQRLAEIEGVLPGDGEGQDEEQNPGSPSHRLIPL